MLYDRDTKKRKILVLASYYLPGFKAGGPIRSIDNIISHYCKDYNFQIITRDRDHGDHYKYENISSNSWNSFNNIEVFYLNRSNCSPLFLLRVIREADPDLIYLNTYFDPCFTIIPLLLRRLGLLRKDIKYLIAPRGEMANGALALKKYRKYFFLYFSKIIRLYNGMLWHASGHHELLDIKKHISGARIFVAPNLSAPVSKLREKITNKVKDRLRVVCVSRIARNKNIDGALRILKEVKGVVDFNIIGPCEDKDYWQECESIIEEMPENISVKYHSQLPHNMLVERMLTYDLFFLPTCGENYGHAIVEAMSVGLPILISDKTPWRYLEDKGVGWDIPLNNVEKYVNVLEQCVNMPKTDYEILSNSVRSYASKILNDEETLDQSRKMFDAALGV